MRYPNPHSNLLWGSTPHDHPAPPARLLPPWPDRRILGPGATARLSSTMRGLAWGYAVAHDAPTLNVPLDGRRLPKTPRARRRWATGLGGLGRVSSRSRRCWCCLGLVFLTTHQSRFSLGLLSLIPQTRRSSLPRTNSRTLSVITDFFETAYLVCPSSRRVCVFSSKSLSEAAVAEEPAAEEEAVAAAAARRWRGRRSRRPRSCGR